CLVPPAVAGHQASACALPEHEERYPVQSPGEPDEDGDTQRQDQGNQCANESGATLGDHVEQHHYQCGRHQVLIRADVPGGEHQGQHDGTQHVGDWLDAYDPCKAIEDHVAENARHNVDCPADQVVLPV